MSPPTGADRPKAMELIYQQGRQDALGWVKAQGYA